MTSSSKYHFADFTRGEYRALLRLARQTYVFRSYLEYSLSERFVLRRHDVDISPQSALKLARIEAEDGVRATYFLHPHSEFYNLLEKPITTCIREILSLGHHVGLHFDCDFFDVSDVAQLESHLAFERDLVAYYFGVRVEVFSFHNPGPFTATCTADRYAGMLNVYGEAFQKRVPYCSDSNGYWRFRRLRDVLEKAEDHCLQLLTHPEWWQDDVLSPHQRVWRSAEGRAESAKRNYSALLAGAGRLDIDWD